MVWDPDMTMPMNLQGTKCGTELKCWDDCYVDGAAACYAAAMDEPRTPDILFSSLPTDRQDAERIFVAFPSSSTRYAITRFAPDPSAGLKQHRTRMLPFASINSNVTMGVDLLQWGHVMYVFESNRWRMFWLYN